MSVYTQIHYWKTTNFPTGVEHKRSHNADWPGLTTIFCANLDRIHAHKSETENRNEFP